MVRIIVLASKNGLFSNYDNGMISKIQTNEICRLMLALYMDEVYGVGNTSKTLPSLR